MVILNVDDDSDNLELFCEAVREINPSIDCIQADSAEKALRMLNEANTLPNYIFLDLNMPLMDGKACLKKIKCNLRLSHIRVIMFSSTTDRSAIRECESLGAAFLKKETSHRRLVEALKRIIQETCPRRSTPQPLPL